MLNYLPGKMNAVIDIGNSKIKIGIFNHGEMKNFFQVESPEEATAILNNSEYDDLLVSSVRKEEPWTELLNVKGRNIILDGSIDLPIKIDYKTPDSLGIDRICAAIGAHLRHPAHHCLVIDLGTCITYDLVDQEGYFRGGAISPGIHMKFRSLHEQTAKLPLVEALEEEIKLTGKSTKESILSGVLMGTRQEIEGFIRSYHHNIANLQIVFTGGGFPLVKNLLDHEYQWYPHLVLEGLNGILEYNAK